MLRSNGTSLFEDLGVNLIQFHLIQDLSSKKFEPEIFVVEVKIPT